MSIDMEKFVAGLHDYLGRALRPVGGRLDGLEKRMDALEASGPAGQGRGIKYMGVFRRDEDYQRGDVVTHQGGMWVRNTDTATKETPGTGPSWTLAVKAGGRP